MGPAACNKPLPVQESEGALYLNSLKSTAYCIWAFPDEDDYIWILLLLSQGLDTCRQVQARKDNEAENFVRAWSNVKEGLEDDEDAVRFLLPPGNHSPRLQASSITP